MAADLFALFSEESFKCLDFDDVATVDEEKGQAVVASIVKTIETLLAVIGYQHVTRPKDLAFRKEFWAWGQAKLSKIICNDAKLHILLDTTASCMEYLYPSSDFEFRMSQGTSTCVAILVDDLIVEDPGALHDISHFSQRYLRGLPQSEGLCDTMAAAYQRIDEFFGSKNPRLGTFGVMGWLSGMDWFCEEAKFAKELPSQFIEGSTGETRTEYCVDKLPYYFRIAAGLAPCYLMPIFKPTIDIEVPIRVWVSAIPYLEAYIILINDILSFRKEFQCRENFNYFSLTTLAKRQAGCLSQFGSKKSPWTFRDTLYEACSEILSSSTALDNLFTKFTNFLSQEFDVAQAQAEANGFAGEENAVRLKKNKEQLDDARLAAKLWTEFRHGYPAWHIHHPRYQLDSVLAAYDKASQNGIESRLFSQYTETNLHEIEMGTRY